MSWWALRVPASSANLGPGFDALGLALELHLRCRFRAAERLAIRASGRDAALIPTGDDNFIWRTALAVARDFGGVMPPVEMEIANDIPIGKGLGSSAAALTAGVVIADKLLGLNWKRPRVLDEAARLEGHPDNVAACVLGSIVASAIDSGGVARAARLEMSAKFGVAVVTPDFVLPTSESRRLLPETYPRADVVYNVQRSALLVAALATGSTGAFPEALGDRLHQPYRASLVPGLASILRLRAPGLLGCALSGAGPSVLVFHERGYQQVCDLVRQIFSMHGHSSEVVCTGVAVDGYELREERDSESHNAESHNAAFSNPEVSLKSRFDSNAK
jgi:homoserine kinase